MLIQEEKLRHWIDHFYGYGSWTAPIWFVAFEEGGGDTPEDVADRINYFHSKHPEPTSTLCDVRKMYQQIRMKLDGPKADVYSNRFEYRFDANAVQHGLWKNLIGFVHGYHGETPDLLAYQQNRFASGASKEALINLFPLPSPHNHAWYYSWLELPGLSFIKSRDAYQQMIYHDRMNTILTRMEEYKPSVVLMYGMQHINLLKESVVTKFPESKFKLVKATPRIIPQHHVADIDNTKLIITTQIPALRHGRVETGHDWNEFGKRLSAS
ncbi:MAG TPA: hypothetical protein VD927_18785 [Chryseosolibacter sp.]|nr:hypothetical protein [Chryseosolibacter sp.]